MEMQTTIKKQKQESGSADNAPIIPEEIIDVIINMALDDEGFTQRIRAYLLISKRISRVILFNLEPMLKFCRREEEMRREKDSNSCMRIDENGQALFDVQAHLVRQQALVTFDLFMAEAILAFGERTSLAKAAKIGDSYRIVLNSAYTQTLPPGLVLVERQPKLESTISRQYLSACNGAISWGMQMVEGPLEEFFETIVRSEWLENDLIMNDLPTFAQEVAFKMDALRHADIDTFGQYMHKLFKWLETKGIADQNILDISSSLNLCLAKRTNFALMHNTEARRRSILDKMLSKKLLTESKDLATECRWRFRALVVCLMRILSPIEALLESASSGSEQ